MKLSINKSKMLYFIKILLTLGCFATLCLSGVVIKSGNGDSQVSISINWYNIIFGINYNYEGDMIPLRYSFLNSIIFFFLLISLILTINLKSNIVVYILKVLSLISSVICSALTRVLFVITSSSNTTDSFELGIGPRLCIIILVVLFLIETYVMIANKKAQIVTN